ncbi:MAG TPA: hypothetical protein VFQ35_17105, partial [Polyangiaceae bacterium]|nr:hypothetical protein [Polyangiaceae bacterium]
MRPSAVCGRGGDGLAAVHESTILRPCALQYDASASDEALKRVVVVKYFPRVPNIYINADGYLKGFLGLTWFPSGDAKAHVAQYERQVAAVLFNIWGRRVGS